jgi:hypothetical protein
LAARHHSFVRNVKQPSTGFSLRSLLGASVAVGAAAFWWYRTHAAWAATLLGVASLLWLLCLLAPRAYLPVQRVFDGFARAVLIAATWVLLALLFVAVFVPGRLLLFLRSRDPLMRRCDPTAATYWQPIPTSERDARFERQY